MIQLLQSLKDSKKKSTTINPFPTSLISGKNLCKNSCLWKEICYVMPPTHLWLMRQVAVNASIILARAPMNGVQQLVHSAPSVFPAKNRSQLCSKRSSKGLPSESFLATGDLFECNTYHVTALGCLKKKEDAEQFWFFDRFSLVISLQNQ